MSWTLPLQWFLWTDEIQYCHEIRLTPCLFFVRHNENSTHDNQKKIIGQLSCHDLTLFSIPRTPFELNTTLRCALMAAFELLTSMSQPCLFGTVPCLLIAFMIYSEACFADIKYLLKQGDCLFQTPELPNAKRISLELKLLEQFKEATDLHRRVIGYPLPFDHSIVF